MERNSEVLSIISFARMNRIFSLSIFLLFLSIYPLAAQQSSVRYVGTMRDAMWKGEIFGKINLDTLQHKEHLYGIGPLANLQGEILINGGHAYQSRVSGPGSMQVIESFDAKAPFFVYDRVDHWVQYPLHDSIRTLKQIEQALFEVSKSHPVPFTFLIMAVMDKGSIHVVNLPSGTIVHNPDEAHQGQVDFPIFQTEGQVVGFFSTQHQGIFTHHSSYVHAHFLSNNHQLMGHVDYAEFQPATLKLFLPFSIP
jgi:acetolactate decarboxylase